MHINRFKCYLGFVGFCSFMSMFFMDVADVGGIQESLHAWNFHDNLA